MPSSNELNARIHELEKQIKTLESKLAEYTKIEEYYLKKYQEIFDETKKARDEEIKQTLENITVEISTLKREKEDLSGALEENVKIQKQLKETDFQLQELCNQTEIVNLDVESEINELEQTGLQTIIQHKEQMRKYVNKINKLLNPPFIVNNIVFLKDALINYLYGEGYDAVKTMKQNHRKALSIKQNLEKKQKEYQEAIVQLQLDKESLLDKYREIEMQSLDNIQKDIVHYSSLQEKYHGDIMEALDAIKEIHKHQIVDVIKKGHVLGYTKEVIGQNVDNLLKLLSQELMTVDTVENKVYQKEKRLRKLQAEAEKLHALDIEKETITLEYKELQNKYLGIQKQVQVIEDFNAKVHDVIDNNDKYHNLAVYYLEYLSLKDHTLNNIKIIQNKIDEINALDELEKVSPDNLEKLAAYNKDMEQEERHLEEARMHIEELQQEKENEKVIKMLLSVKEYEEKLPSIYDTMETLKKEIDEKYEHLTQLKEQLVEYQSILLQIEGLTNDNLD